MAAEEKPVARGSVATVVATAAVTLAIGVTVAALGGYLVPAGNGGGVIEAPLASPPSAPGVVFVPVAPDPLAQPSEPAGAPEVILAEHDRSEHDDDDHHGRHHDRDGEDDDDDGD